MKSNFDFLQTEFPVLSTFGCQAEKYCFSDPNSCLMKLGMIGESIVNLMFTYDRIQLPYDNTAVTRIDTLQREGLLTRDLTDILHALRKARNKAVHENYDSESECKILLQMAYSLCEWFMQTYGDWNYQHHDFIMPELENKRVSVTQEEKAAEERQAEELTKQAEQKASTAEAISKSERQKQAGKMASQRPKSEAETRYIIDEQLRQVGWEADTENLRYSKGTRPAKGHNMAIAEWPTNSSVGQSGRVDYALFVDTKLIGVIEASGEILLGAENISELPLPEYRNMVSVVSQQIYLFNDTIRNNICLYKQIDDTVIEAACKDSGLEDFIKEVSLDHVVGQNGAMLSGGQKQKIALARALVHDKPIIIFDEATSNTDAYSEQQINGLLDTRLKDKTVIVITHKKEILSKVDQIVVLKEGVVADLGRYDDLIGKSDELNVMLEKAE